MPHFDTPVIHLTGLYEWKRAKGRGRIRPTDGWSQCDPSYWFADNHFEGSSPAFWMSPSRFSGAISDHFRLHYEMRILLRCLAVLSLCAKAK